MLNELDILFNFRFVSFRYGILLGHMLASMAATSIIMHGAVICSKSRLL